MTERNFNPYEHARISIATDYNDDVSIKPKRLLKFGRNPNVGTSKATIQQFLQSGTPEINETYAATNAIDKVVSSSGSDTSKVVTIEGHTISGGVFTFASQSVTLTGQTAATLTTPLARATLVFLSSGAALAGTVAVFEDSSVSSGVPQDNTKVHVIADATEQQSLKASTTFSNVDYGIVTSLYGSIGKDKNANAVVRFEVREVGGVFRTQFTYELDNVGTGGFLFNPEPFIIIPKNSDVRFTAIASTTAVIVSTGFNAYLALVRS
jgi:hypothetical protein